MESLILNLCALQNFHSLQFQPCWLRDIVNVQYRRVYSINRVQIDQEVISNLEAASRKKCKKGVLTKHSPIVQFKKHFQLSMLFLRNILKDSVRTLKQHKLDSVDIGKAS